MAKNLNMNAMDKLISGLTGKEEHQEPPTIEQGSGSTSASNETMPQSDQPRSSKLSRKKPVKKHICTNVDVEKLDKIKTIADKEGLNINDIFDLALSITINKYEELHGIIQVKKPKKCDVRKVFNI